MRSPFSLNFLYDTLVLHCVWCSHLGASYFILSKKKPLVSCQDWVRENTAAQSQSVGVGLLKQLWAVFLILYHHSFHSLRDPVPPFYEPFKILQCKSGCFLVFPHPAQETSFSEWLSVLILSIASQPPKFHYCCFLFSFPCPCRFMSF